MRSKGVQRHDPVRSPAHSPEDHPNKPRLIVPEWLTYAQAGAKFGLSPDAMRMRARRLGWRSQPGNDGKTLIMVPDHAALQPRERANDGLIERTPEQTAPFARLTELIATADARAERAELRADRAEQRAEQAERKADAAIARADAADADRRAAQARAERAEQAAAGERARADALHDRLNELEPRANRAENEMHDLNAQLAEVKGELAAAKEWAARPWWRRLGRRR